METQSLIVAVVTAICGLLGGAFGKDMWLYFTTRSAAATAHDLTIIEKLERRIGELEDERDADNARLKEWASKIESERNDCRQEHAKLSLEVGFLKGQIAELSKQVCPFPAAHHQNATSAIQPSGPADSGIHGRQP